MSRLLKPLILGAVFSASTVAQSFAGQVQINQLPAATTSSANDAIPTQQAADGVTRYVTPGQIIAGGGGATASALGAEVSARVAGDAANSTAISNETTRAEGVEATKAPLVSPALTGTPTAPTASALTNNTQIGTTAYTDSAVGVEKSRAQGVEATLLPLAGGAISGDLSVAGTFNNGKPVPEVQTDAALVSFPVSGLSAGYTVRAAGYRAAGDMPAALYSLQNSACSLNSGAGDGGSQVASATPNKCWIMQQPTVWDVRNFGAYCDYNSGTGTGTVDTTAIQNAINASQTAPLYKNGTPVSQLHFPPSCLTGPLMINRPIVISGDGENLSHLAFVKGGTGALFTIALAYDNGNYYNIGEQPATVFVKDMALDGPGAADSGAADGVDLRTAATNPIYGRIIFRNVRVSYFAGDNINAVGFGSNGYAMLEDMDVFAAGANNLNSNSNYDWEIINSNFHGAVNNNVLLSGSAGMKFFGSSAWNAGANNVQIYLGSGSSGSGLNQWFGGSIDHAGHQNVYYDARGTNSPFLFSGVAINNAGGSASPGVYSDIYVLGTANNDLILNGVMFSAPHSVNSSNASLWNIQFSGTTQYVSTSNISLQSTTASAYSNPYQVVGTSWQGEANVADELHTGSAVSFAGNTSGYTGLLPQGPSLGWNYSNGGGEADLFLGQGVGTSGGLAVYAVGSSGAIGSKIASLSNTGNLSISGSAGLGITKVTSSTQYTGFSLSNGTNTVASIAGYSATDDAGVFSLNNNGTTNVQLSAGSGYAPNFINGPLTLGNGQSNASPSSGTLQGTNGSGTNISSSSFNIIGGLATGTGTDGDIVLKTGTNAGSSGATQASANTALTIKGETQNVIVSKNLTVNGSYLSFAGNTSGYASTLSSGPTFGWNYSGGTGESDLFLGQGAGSSGGLYVYPVNGSGAIGSKIASLTSSGNLQISGSVQPSSTAGIVGTTAGDSANAGSVGEIIQSDVPIGSKVTLTSGAISNIASVSLTPGDWSCTGSLVLISGGSSTVVQSYQGWLSTASAATPSSYEAVGYASVYGQSISNTPAPIGVNLGPVRFNSSSSQTVYMETNTAFTTSAEFAYGLLSCRRVR